MQGAANCDEAPSSVVFDPPCVWINAARRRGVINLCAGEGPTTKLTCPSQSPQHSTPLFPINAVNADPRSYASLLEPLCPLCSLVPHPESNGCD